MRDRYAEYRSGSTTIALIEDPKNPRAWIESTVVVSVER